MENDEWNKGYLGLQCPGHRWSGPHRLLVNKDFIGGRYQNNIHPKIIPGWIILLVKAIVILDKTS